MLIGPPRSTGCVYQTFRIRFCCRNPRRHREDGIFTCFLHTTIRVVDRASRKTSFNLTLVMLENNWREFVGHPYFVYHVGQGAALHS